MKLISPDELPNHVCTMLQSEALATAPVKAFIAAADSCEQLQALRAAHAAINQRRSNEGLAWLSDSVFSLLEFDCERHAKNKTEQRKLEALQKRAARALGVPARESSLPWLIFASSQNAV